MTPSAPRDAQGTSTRPYLIRALHEWCTDNGFTPYLAVHVDDTVQVPNEYVKNNEIVLNVGFDATQGLKLGNEVIEFRARFGGVAREIAVPVDHVIAIYARENGQGMAFPTPTPAVTVAPGPSSVVSITRETGAGAEPPSERAAPTLRLATHDASTIKPPQAGRADNEPPEPPEPQGGGGRPTLKRVK